MLPLNITTHFDVFSVEFAGPEIVSAENRHFGDDDYGNGSVRASQKLCIALLFQQLENFLDSF